MRVGTEDRLLVAYNDQFGFERITGPGTVAQRSQPSFAGLSISHDAGATWIRHAILRPRDPSCLFCCPASEAPCINLVDSDPWLATNGEAVIYTIMGSTNGTRHTDSVAVFRSPDGGTTWSPANKAVYRPSGFIDKPSSDMLGSVAVTAFIDLHAGTSVAGVTLGMGSSDDAGVTWRDHGDLPAPRVDATKVQYQNPIIKLATARRGYIAYLGYRPTEKAHLDVHVVRIARDLLVGGGMSDWHLDGELLRVENIEIAPTVATGVEPTAPNPPRPRWGDGIPMSFDIGDVGASPHLYVAWRANLGPPEEGRDQSQVWLADCVDGVGGTCGQGQSGGWRVRRPDPDRVQQYQPVVTAAPGGAVALSWYQSNDTNEFVHRLNVRGTFSVDAGTTLNVPFPIRPAALDWAPCPRLDGQYGDYIASVIVPGRTVSNRPWIVTAYADSSYSSASATATSTGCEQTTTTAYDQHVQATVW